LGEGLRPIPRPTLEKLFQIVRYDERLEKRYPKEPHKWYRNKSKAERDLKLSRPTIDKWLNRFPHGVPALRAPRLTEPKYVEDFNATEAWQRLKDHKYAKEIKTSLLTAWKLLGKREPIEWTDQDVRDLRKPTVTRKGITQDNTLYLPLTKDIAPEHAVNLRRALHALSLYMLEKPLEEVPKRPHGSRQQWFLENSDLINLLSGADDIETLLFCVLGIQCGARPTSMTQIRVSDINFEKNYIQYYEGKRRQYIPRFFIPETMMLLRRYISDKNLKMTDRLFSQDAMEYTNRLKTIGFSQNIPKLQAEGAGAYLLRHTFATQASEHDVSLEVVMKQGGWTDASTLLNHYLFVKSSKMQRELLGVEVEKPLNFGQWIKQFMPYWEKRYNELRMVKP